ncbi:MAG TPA: HDIG domain-containing protein, partial [Dehalococcoidia bacterium]|nr:HDIG domain-containing protein [Dehalococcoidia bacterium]
MNPEETSSSRIAALAEEVRRGNRSIVTRATEAMARPNIGLGLLIALVFASVVGLVSVVTNSQPLVAVGRVMNETRLVRTEIVTTDEIQTEQKREQARQAVPRVFVADQALLDRIQSDLENLPRALATVETFEALDPEIRRTFGLTPEMFAALKGEVVDGGASSGWTARVRALMALLQRRPFLDGPTRQKAMFEGTATTVRLVVGSKSTHIPRSDLLDIDDHETFADAVRAMARDAGFTGPLRQVVVNRLTVNPRPTFTFDQAATAKDQNEAAQAVAPVEVVNPVGQVIFRRGEVLTEAQATLLAREMAAYERAAAPYVRWLRRGSIIAISAAVTLALAGYTLLFCPRIRRNVSRILGVAAILLVAFLTACGFTVWAPQLGALTTICPTLLVAILIVIGYDRRAALAYALLHGLLVCAALRESLGTFGVITAGVAAVVWSLREIRDRNGLLRSTLTSALVVSLAMTAFALMERPITPQSLRQIGFDTALVGGGAILTGASTLFLLPLIERAFNVTTAMTLIELRDPHQPLLRELQRRAPGTYTHSLNVASIAETAAHAIGADHLLTYVGALYHDIGKMSKPEYFVENQQGGPNRHDRLSPALSLLIVVGHVKDGMELAREFRLPQRVQHFIESHHGTTLVEYFYHRARAQALATAPKGKDGKPIEEDTVVPDEIEYRYPGPKPHTREAAILMIADASESAARALPDPSPAKIDQLVRDLAHSRLLDGQFDECDLTFKDL